MFGQRLELIRRQLNLTQSQFAQILGIKQSVYGRYRDGVGNITADMLLSLLKRLNINPTWLISGEGTMFLPAPGESRRDAYEAVKNATLEAVLQKAADYDRLKAEFDALKQRLGETVGERRYVYLPIRGTVGEDDERIFGRKSPEDPPVKKTKTVTLPFYGRIAAGQPCDIEDDMSFRRLTVDEDEAVDEKSFYLLQISGESMIDAGINDGDVVLIRAADRAESGEIAVCRSEEENRATLKKLWYTDDGRVELRPMNSAMKPVYVPIEQLRVDGIFIKKV